VNIQKLRLFFVIFMCSISTTVGNHAVSRASWLSFILGSLFGDLAIAEMKKG
jgi:hypothetical protein